MNKTKKLFLAVAVTVLIAPSIALATWWNPLSWFNHWGMGAVSSSQATVDNSTLLEILSQRLSKINEEKMTGYQIPDNIKMISDAYIVNRIGENNFKKYFVFAKSGHSYATSDPKGYYTDYQAVYHFLPLAVFKFDEDMLSVTVRASADGSIVDVSGDMVPNCLRDVSQCEFRITKNKALQIARKHGFKSNDLTVRLTQFVLRSETSLSFAIEVNSCSKNMAMLIDYRNGKVISFKPEMICGGQTGVP